MRQLSPKHHHLTFTLILGTRRRLHLNCQDKSNMEILSGPWADVAMLLRQTVTQTESETDGFLPLWLFGLLLFLSACLLLLQLIIYFNWKLRQAEADLSGFPRGRSAIYRDNHRSAHLRRRSVG